jgi:hypothetical protein
MLHALGLCARLELLLEPEHERARVLELALGALPRAVFRARPSCASARLRPQRVFDDPRQRCRSRYSLRRNAGAVLGASKVSASIAPLDFPGRPGGGAYTRVGASRGSV